MFQNIMFLCIINNIPRVIQKLELNTAGAQNLSQMKSAPKQHLCLHRCDAGRSQSLGRRRGQNQFLNHERYKGAL